ncbi:3-oxo-tetronate kinase [Paracoccus versutus]|uniref:3-oxo-tetronate kinase n=1 Tax=Paracoccus versutus TaxID=34007 RepID=UPI000DF7B528|nr:3-oxo-tetronate kinase [Paracoccus versutus]RDD69839.1 four-carbon acid sugar kinase family protein [Paracoccus versutus]
MSRPILGVIADDFTGATDIASMLARGGMRVVQTIGPEAVPLVARDTDAVVIALKTRSIAACDAVAQSLAALDALRRAGIPQVQFKYCSTFDSTPEGNIAPVSEALAEALGCPLIPHVPALPVNGRTVYKGHLFVGDALLHESGMQAHPLNPMTDANLVRWLGRQTSRPVGLADHQLLSRGPDALREALERMRQDGILHVIGDAIDEDALSIWARVLSEYPFFAGGSGLATPLARRLGETGRFTPDRNPPGFASETAGHTLILAGSCSTATLAQIQAFRDKGGQIRQIEPTALNENPKAVQDLIGWAADALKSGPALIHGSTGHEEVAAAQRALGISRAGQIVEAALSKIARALVRLPQTGRLVVAGGETSGAVVSALDVAALRIGAEIDPGVPWTLALEAAGRQIIPLALKSGNFGGPDFFLRTAWGMAR